MRPVEDPKRVLYEKWFFHGGNAVQTGLAVGGQGKEGIKRCRKYDAQRAMRAQKSGWSKIKGDQRQEKRRREAICNNEAHLAVWERASEQASTGDSIDLNNLATLASGIWNRTTSGAPCTINRCDADAAWPPITIMHFNLSDNCCSPLAAEQMRSHRWLERGRA